MVPSLLGHGQRGCGRRQYEKPMYTCTEDVNLPYVYECSVSHPAALVTISVTTPEYFFSCPMLMSNGGAPITRSGELCYARA